MNWEDEDDDFDFNEEFSHEENGHDDHLYEAATNYESHQLYRLAHEIFKTVDALIECSTKKDYDFFKQSICRSADLLIIKFEEAMNRRSWTNAMECAAIIRFEAKILLAQTGLMKNFLGVENKYVVVLRKELIRFKTLFNDWLMEIQDFDEEDVEDEWGLFLRGKM